MKKNVKKFLLALTVLSVAAGAFAREPLSNPSSMKMAYNRRNPSGDGKNANFKETWGYVSAERHDEFDANMPITDLAVFAANVNCYGELCDIPNENLFSDFTGRKHLVVICESKAGMHMILEKKFGLRDQLVEDIAKAAASYDGVQIDFEIVPARDSLNFRTFLRDIREAIGTDKIFSVALPARMKYISDDIYEYSVMETLVDRVIIMAYDQHWSSSKPGAVAEFEWGKKIARYAQSVIPAEKLVIGLPFYGRTWQSDNYGKAWYFSGINRIMNENGVDDIERIDGIAKVEFTKEIKVIGYFDDAYSIVQRCKEYNQMGIDKVAFWRIGQEDRDCWNFIKIPE